MKLYTLSVRRWWVMVPAVLALMLVTWLIGASQVPVPSLLGGAGMAQIKHFVPVIVSVAVMYCLDRRLPEAELTAVVPVRRIDRAAVSAGAVLLLAAAPAVGLDVARNTLLILALALVVRRIANEATAVAAGLLYIIANVMLGQPPDPLGYRIGSWWALPLYPAGSIPALAFVGSLFAGALAWGLAPHARTR
ncbi:hypothetical protein EES41_39545 (plasmid) [Streptomyces sp. ADI95-16]|uniref:hypothetical protein n=1 Tax=Streptomyces sp. ADI95-16 TaxID=1522758 RepID=UPI000F3A9D14|nr:hypothetical protein [Streptomyces sp. ADI95-16]AYV32869.1 hypothetical protein EES41_39545 [Streptomyces sp. ADI95-16]